MDEKQASREHLPVKRVAAVRDDLTFGSAGGGRDNMLEVWRA
jgi:hypothetical protein